MFARRATPRTPGMRDWVRLVINIVLGACLVGQCSFNSTNVVSGVSQGGWFKGRTWMVDKTPSSKSYRSTYAAPSLRDGHTCMMATLFVHSFTHSVYRVCRVYRAFNTYIVPMYVCTHVRSMMHCYETILRPPSVPSSISWRIRFGRNKLHGRVACGINGTQSSSRPYIPFSSPIDLFVATECILHWLPSQLTCQLPLFQRRSENRTYAQVQ